MSLQVTHREISVSLTQTIMNGRAASEGSRKSAANQPEQEKLVAPATCPDCGAPWLSNFAEVLSNFRIPLELLRAALHDRSIHSFWLADGQFLVCAESLKTITETPS